jgi:DNA ligase-associated metallophosphoesterase
LIDLDVAGTTLQLHPERAVYWTPRRTLFVADPHFGKAASFRAAGVFVPEETTQGALGSLDVLLDRTGATRLIFLGDFLHAKEGRHPDTLRALNDWRERHANVAMVIVRGNHDRHAGDPPRELRMQCVDGPMLEPPFAFAHRPTTVAEHYVLAGHVHPAAKLSGAGRQHERLPCFWFRASQAILPAFGEFTGLADVFPDEHERVFVVAGDDVVRAR